MKDTYIFVNDDDNLELDIVKHEVVTSFAGDIAKNYIKTFYNMEPKEVIEGENDLIISYLDEKLILENVDRIFVNKDNRNLFRPIFEMSLSVVNKDNMKRAKNKKVKRKNKYARKKIIASVLVALIIGITSSSHTFDKNKDKETTKEVKNKAETVQNIDDVKSEKEVKKVKSIEDKKSKNDSKEKNDADRVETIYVDYDDRSDSDKAINAQKYKDVIEKYSEMYGLDSKLMLALAIQERGEHSTVKDSGGATGLMQIQNDVWKNGNLTAYNFNTNSWDSIIVDETMLSDLDYNVKVGCMIFQSYLKHADYNVLQALQGYNMGIYSVDNIVKIYCANEGKSLDDVRCDQNDLGWISYRDNVSFGDSNYIEHVLSYCGANCNFKFKKPDNEEIVLNITSNEAKKSLKI